MDGIMSNCLFMVQTIVMQMVADNDNNSFATTLENFKYI